MIRQNLEVPTGESRERTDKAGFFHYTKDGKLESGPMPKDINEQSMPESPLDEIKNSEDPAAQEAERLRQLEAKTMADEFNQMLGDNLEKKKAEPEPNFEQEFNKSVLDQLLDAKDITEFESFCDNAIAKNENVEVNGTPVNPDLLKTTFNNAKALVEQKKAMGAVKELQQVPAGPLRDKIEKLIGIPGMTDFVESELNQAYGGK